jgi:hypothetical protein
MADDTMRRDTMRGAPELNMSRRLEAGPAVARVEELEHRGARTI